MNVTSLCPLRVGSVRWQSSRGGWALTVVCKATFRFAPGECQLIPEQELVNEDDRYRGDDPSASLLAPSDLVPFKARADVVLVGKAYAPGGRPVRSLVARLSIGGLEKAIQVSGARTRMPTGELLEGTGFVSMPLSYEHAAGGPGTWNPVGVRPDAPPDARGNIPLPNLTPVGKSPSARGEVIEPVGFGPIAPGWSGRSMLLGRRKASWSPTAWHHQPLPEGLDPRCFNAAPLDQQIDELRGDERIALENLHPEFTLLVTRLPGLLPRAFVERPGVPPRELALRCDTLWIDTDRALCTVTWRGQLTLDDLAETGRVLIVMDKPGHRTSWADVELLTRAVNMSMPDDPTHTLQLSHDVQPKPALPFAVRTYDDAGAGNRQAVGAEAQHVEQGGEDTLDPFSDSTKPFMRRPTPALPFVGTASAAVGAEQPAVGSAPPHIVPPSIVRASIAAEVIAPVIPPSPWSAKEPLASASALGKLVGHAPDVPPPPMVGVPVAAFDAGERRSPDDIKATDAEPAKADSRTVRPEAAVLRGAVAASNAAAGASEMVERAAASAQKTAEAPSRERPREMLELIWYDPAALPRIRRNLTWKKIISELKPRSSDEDFDGGLTPDKMRAAKDRRDVFGVLARGEPVDMAAIEKAVSLAVADDGSFVPPYVLTAGELSFPFDEREVLNVMSAIAAPLAAGDKKLKDAVDAANALLKTPSVHSLHGFAEEFIARLKDAFRQSNRTLPERYLETQTERALLEQQSYQKRTVIGQPCSRALLTPAGATIPIPAYVPDSASNDLLMFNVFNARVIAEARVQFEQHEASWLSFRVLALARSILQKPRKI